MLTVMKININLCLQTKCLLTFSKVNINFVFKSFQFDAFIINLCLHIKRLNYRTVRVWPFKHEIDPPFRKHEIDPHYTNIQIDEVHYSIQIDGVHYFMHRKHKQTAILIIDRRREGL